MEDVVDVYCRPSHPEKPVVCMDEQPVQLVKEVRLPLPARSGKPVRHDYEYERNGRADIFLFTEPLGGWRKVNVRCQRTAVDWAAEIKELLPIAYPAPLIVTLICDNLNTHTGASLYEAYPAEEARGVAKRLDIHYTPKHGSWLNVAECELSVLTKQGLAQRIPDIPALQAVTKGWEVDRNGKQKGVDWQFTTRDARIKLNRLYPIIQL